MTEMCLPKWISFYVPMCRKHVKDTEDMEVFVLLLHFCCNSAAKVTPQF